MNLDDAETWRWIWVGATLFFAISEIAVPGTFFMISFAVGAFAAAVVAFIGASLLVQWIAFVGATVVALLLLVPLGRRLTRTRAGETGVGATRWEGRRALVIGAIPDGPNATGLVRIEREQWRAESADGRSVAEGETVQVLRVDGTRLIVGPVEATEGAAPGGPAD